MSDWIYLSQADISTVEERYVLDALRSGWVAPAGPDLACFEEEIARRASVEHAVALSSGTAALHLALVSWGIGPGDIVPVPTLTFAATVNAIRYVGAEPFFVDCETDSGNISPLLLRRALEHLRRSGQKVRVIVTVDLLGKAVDYSAITALSQEFGTRLLCDSAESFGATRHGEPAGSFGDASMVSFNGNKIMTTSGGGMLLTRDPKLAQHVRKLSTQAREPFLHYEHAEVGYNYRLSNVLAALGRAQLSRLDEMIAQRRKWRSHYKDLFGGRRGVKVLGGVDDTEDNCWLTAIVVNEEEAGFSAEQLSDALRNANIETRPIWKPMHLQPVFARYDHVLDGSSQLLFDRGLTLPSGSGMTDEQFARVAAKIAQVIQ